jgi:radical SAM superfamily enzyme YgiQ (UPF0313 family)
VKVVLAKPCWNYPKGETEATYNRIWPPLELANCAAILREAGHEAAIIDAQALDLDPEELAAQAKESDPDLVILTSTGLDRWQCPYNDPLPFLTAARALVKAGLRVVATGFYPTINAEAVLSLTGIEAAIRGEPEGPVSDFARGGDLAAIDGVSYGDGGEVRNNPAHAPFDLAALPCPAFELFDIERYFYEVLGRNFLLFELTRGCPYNCTFCSKVMYGEEFRKKTLEQVRREIDCALSRTMVRSAYFIDLEFTVASELAEGVCRYLADLGAPLEWCCQTRADRVDAELVDLMRRAGCRLIHIGVESGSERVLEASGKATSKERIRDGVRLIHEAGIETLAFFMFGLPGETDAEREETIEFALELEPSYASFHFATPYPGSRLFDSQNLRIGEDLSLPLVPAGASLAELKGWVRKAMWRFYLRPSYVTRHVLRGGPSNWWRQLRLFVSYFR